MFDRHERVNALFAELAAEFIRHEANTDPLITVTGTTTSKDYENATIYVTTIPDDREADALIFLRRHGGAFRKFVKKHSNVKVVPRFSFEIDAGERHRQHVDEVVRKIEGWKDAA